MATREELLTVLRNKELIEQQKIADASGPIKDSTIVDILNPANKGLSAINDLMRIIGEETTGQVLQNPTNFGRDVPNEFINRPLDAINAAGRGLSQGFLFGLGEEASALPYSAVTGRSFSDVDKEFEGYTKAAQESAPQSFALAERIGELAGLPGKAGEKVLAIAGKVLGIGGKLVGDLELGGRKLGEKFNRLLPKVKSIDDAYAAAAKKISSHGELRDMVVSKYDDVAAIGLPGGKNGMALKDLEDLAADYITAGDKAAGEKILKMAVKIENGEKLIPSEALNLKTFLNHEVYLPSGKLRNTKSSKVMASWAEDLRKSVIDTLTDQNDKLKVVQLDKDMADLYELRGAIEKAQKRPISVSLSGLAKATVGRPSVFNVLQNVGKSLQSTEASVGTRAAVPVAGQVFEEQGPTPPRKGQ